MHAHATLKTTWMSCSATCRHVFQEACRPGLSGTGPGGLKSRPGSSAAELVRAEKTEQRASCRAPGRLPVVIRTMKQLRLCSSMFSWWREAALLHRHVTPSSTIRSAVSTSATSC
jgi:hypothetical protein